MAREWPDERSYGCESLIVFHDHRQQPHHARIESDIDAYFVGADYCGGPLERLLRNPATTMPAMRAVLFAQ